MNRSSWDKRIQRAEDLCRKESASREVLTLYRHIVGLQRKMFNDALARPVPEMSPQPELRKHIEVDRALRWLPELMDTLEQRGPAKLAAEAQRMRSLSAEEQSALLTGYLRDGLDTTAAASFIARLLFQPYAEFMAMQVPAVPTTSATVCPICGGKPQFAVLRPEGDGGKRHLTCSFCST